MKALLTLLALLPALPLFAEKRPFERYQSIVDRQMFGRPPPGFDPTRSAAEASRASRPEISKEQEQIQSAVHFSMINVTPDGATAVGFTDNSVQPARHYYLKVGETRDGWTVKEADPVKAKMTVEKGDVAVTLDLGANSAKAGAPGKAGAGPSANGAKRPGGILARSPLPDSASGAPAGGSALGASLQARREARARERQAQRAAEEAKAAEEKARREQEQEATRKELQALREQIKEDREAREAEKAARAEQERQRRESEGGEETGERQ